MPRRTFKCGRCKRKFSMAAHLARHMSAMHGSRKRKKAAKRKIKRRARRVGRPKALTTRLGLKDMNFDQLRQLIDAVRAEARRRMAELQGVFR